MVVWAQKGCRCSSWPWWSWGWPGPMACCSAQPWERIILHVASLGKDPNSKFEIGFLLEVYCFHTITKLKDHKSNHCKSGTVCMYTVLKNLTRTNNTREQRLPLWESSVCNSRAKWPEVIWSSLAFKNMQISYHVISLYPPKLGKTEKSGNCCHRTPGERPSSRLWVEACVVTTFQRSDLPTYVKIKNSCEPSPRDPIPKNISHGKEATRVVAHVDRDVSCSIIHGAINKWN